MAWWTRSFWTEGISRKELKLEELGITVRPTASGMGAAAQMYRESDL
jgi:hypothetical protein